MFCWRVGKESRWVARGEKDRVAVLGRRRTGCFNREQGTPVWLPVLGAKNPNDRVAARNEEMPCAGSAGRG